MQQRDTVTWKSLLKRAKQLNAVQGRVQTRRKLGSEPGKTVDEVQVCHNLSANHSSSSPSMVYSLCRSKAPSDTRTASAADAEQIKLAVFKACAAHEGSC